MLSSFRKQCEKWSVDEALRRYPGLSLQSADGSGIHLRGEIDFRARYPNHPEIDDTYEVEICIPKSFPRDLPTAMETGGRIPGDFHTNYDKTLCLGSEVRQHLLLGKSPSLHVFVEKCLIPFLYGFSHKEQFGELPFGELSHGKRGIIEDYMTLFRVTSKKVCIDLLALAAMKKRSANKEICPCSSGRRVGKCHNRVLNHYRRLLGRKWFAQEHKRLSGR
jgi:hypothetical protein